MKKQILLPPAVASELCETFHVERNTLRRSLNYELNSSNAKMLRAAALERGGLIFTGEAPPPGYCPNVKTRYSKSTIVQGFGSGRVELRIARDTDTATVIIDDRIAATFYNMTVNECPLPLATKGVQSINRIIKTFCEREGVTRGDTGAGTTITTHAWNITMLNAYAVPTMHSRPLRGR